jgi:hypothetical protein
MATINEIMSDPRFAKATPEQKQRLIHKASDRNTGENTEPGVYGETSPFGQRLLENAGIAAGGYGVGSLVGTGVAKAAESKLGRAIFNSPRTIGEEMKPGLAKARIKDRPPELAETAKFEDPYQYPSQLSEVKRTQFMKGVPGPLASTGKKIPRLKPQFPAEPLPTSVPLKYPEDPATLYNFANARLKGFASDPKNVKLTAQELNDYKTILSEKLTEMTRQGMAETPIYQKLSDLQSRVSGIHGRVVPGRADLNEVYGMSKNIRKIPGKIYSGAKTAAKYGTLAAALGYGASKLYK